MKKKTVFLGCLAIIVLSVFSVMPAGAYTITVTSELSEEDGKVFTSVRWGLTANVHNFNDGYGIHPGQTVTYSNDKWYNKGLCWDDLGVEPAKQWEGCAAPQWKHITLTKCRDIKVILRRSGCSVEIYVH